MSGKNSKSDAKRASKSQRTHVRRMKQEARKEAPLNSPQSAPVQPVAPAKKKDAA